MTHTVYLFHMKSATIEGFETIATPRRERPFFSPYDVEEVWRSLRNDDGVRS